MSVPLDRLYDFLHDSCNQDIVIYRFSPHGSKKVEDLIQHNDNIHIGTHPIMICHDQEPLSWEHGHDSNGCKFRMALPPAQRFKHFLLLHSEKNSNDVELFVRDRIFPVYYWSHALIARDWFRYAEIDPVLRSSTSPAIDFLVYQRAWSNTREYRLKFTELLLNKNLQDRCLIKFNPVDDNVNYRDYKWINQDLKIDRYDFEQILPLSTATSNASADYQNTDYTKANIEVVLETLFDDSRWHLTEKVFRPIACSKPFILAATPNSLEYIRSYGFKTFAPYINESYDQESNPVIRLQMIVDEMQRITNLSQHEKTLLFENVNNIARYNQQHFFSDCFLNTVVKEYSENLSTALDQWNLLSQRRLR